MSSNVLLEQRIDKFNFHDHRTKRGRLQFIPHLHRALEIVFLYQGKTVVCADTFRGELSPGDVFFTFPNQIHSYETLQEEKYVILFLPPELFPDLSEFLLSATPESPVVKGAAEDPTVLALLELLVASGQPTDSLGVAYQNGILKALVSFLLSRMKVSRLETGDSSALRSIVSFCTANYAENLSLSMLEDKLHLNKYYISHLFSGGLGLRFNDYINSLRVSEACRYLLNSDLSITEISEHVGFNTLRTFNRAFIKQVGVSPSDYKKNNFTQKEEKKQ